jgi:hypothetical protein
VHSELIPDNSKQHILLSLWIPDNEALRFFLYPVARNILKSVHIESNYVNIGKGSEV